MLKRLLLSILLLTYLSGWAQKFEFAKGAGGKSNDVSNSVFVGGHEVFITGSFKGTATFDNTSITSNGNEDVFVAKYNDSCSLQWVKSFGGKGEDVANSVTADEKGNIYVAGYFNGTISFEKTTLTSNGADIFIVKYDSAGVVIWAKKAGGADNDYAYALNTDKAGNVYVTGDFSGSANFDNTILKSSGMKDAFIAKYDSAGVLQWVQKAGGTKNDAGNGIYVDNIGNTFVTGEFSDSASFGPTRLISNGASDMFIAKYNSSGNVEWVKNAGGKNNDAGNAIKKDGWGNIYVTGNFRGTASFADTSITSSGGADMFVAKYNSLGRLLWVRQAGGKENEESNGITVDGNGNSYITGSFKNTMHFQRTNDLYSDEGTDVFIVKYDSVGKLVWTQRAGGLSNDLAQGIDIDQTGNIYITGVFKELSRFGKIRLYNTNETGTSDIFIAKIAQPVLKKCKCEAGKNVIKWQPFSYLVGYGRLAYERAIDNKTSFQIEGGYLNNQIDYMESGTSGGMGHLNTSDYNVIVEYRHYFNTVLRGGYYAPFLIGKWGVNQFNSEGEDGIDSNAKKYYKERSVSIGPGATIGYQYIFRNCITVDGFIGGYVKIGSTYGRIYYTDVDSDDKIKVKFPDYTPFASENTGVGFRFGLKIGYTF
jgi:hypothetical protein